MQRNIPGSGRSVEKEMATHSRILAWEIQWTEEPGGLQSIGTHRVGHDWVTNTFSTMQQIWEKYTICSSPRWNSCLTFCHNCFRYFSPDEWIKKMWHIYTMEYHSAIKRNKIGSFVETCMDLQTVTQSEVRENRKRKTQKEKNKYHIFLFIFNQRLFLSSALICFKEFNHTSHSVHSSSLYSQLYLSI